MKRKQLAKRVAIAMLSAATVMTAAPVGTFAATNVVSVDASDANAYGSQTVNEDQGELKTLVDKQLTSTASGTVKSNSDADTIATYFAGNTATSTTGVVLKDTSKTNPTKYTISNFAIEGTPTAPSFKMTAGGGEVVMPVITVRADVQIETWNGSAYNPKAAYGTVTFTIDATALTTSERVDAAKAVIEAAGGKTIVDPTVGKTTTYSNNDNSTSLRAYVDAILADANDVDTTPATGTIKNLSKIGSLTEVKVTQGAVTPATKDAAGSEVVNVSLKNTLAAATDKTDAKWDKTKTPQSDDQEYKVTASYTATIPQIGTTSADTDYQARVEAALKNVTLTNTDFDGAAGHQAGGVTTKVTTALAAIGLNETSNLSVSYRNLTKASHKADGSVQILVDQKRDSDAGDKHEYATVTVPVTHADDVTEVEKEVSKQLVSTQKALAADSKDIVLTSLDEDAQKKAAKAGIEKKVNEALADTLGGTNTVASEVKKVEVELNGSYTKATTAKKGSTGYKVTVTFKNDIPAALTDAVVNGELASTGSSTVTTAEKKIAYTFNAIDLYHVDGVKATGISLEDQYAAPYDTAYANEKVTVTPKFTPSNANDYKVRWILSGDDASKFILSAPAGVVADVAWNATSKSIVVSNSGVVVTANSAVVDPGTEVTLTAQLIDSNNLVAGTATTTVKVVKGFSDVQNSHDYAYTAINDLAKEFSVKVDGKWAKTQVIAGIGDNKFNPDGDVTRAQFVTFLYRLAQKDTNRAAKTASVNASHEENGVTVNYDGTTDPVTEGTWVDFSNAKAQTKFTDVDSNAYYAKAVDWAVANGIASGTSDTTFSPNKVVTRAQAVAFLQRYFAAGQQYNVAAKFDDVKSTDYFAQAVGWATATGVTQGKDDNHFAPNDTTSRKEAAAFIYRASNYYTGTSKVNR